MTKPLPRGPQAAADALLEVAGLRVTIGTGAKARPVVRDVAFSIARGEIVGLIGESGSGKTLTALSLIGLLPPGARSEAALMRWQGRACTPRAAIPRGRGIGMIFQDPVGTFNPVRTIGWHLRAALARAGCPRGRRLDRALALLDAVSIRDPQRVIGSYPHRLSGGMLQRIAIALVTAVEPALVIADEPTTNLDALVERQVMGLIERQRRERGAAVLLITHDLALAATTCDRIAVMQAGRIVEMGASDQVLDHPQHPYARGLAETGRSLARGDPWLFEMRDRAAGP